MLRHPTLAALAGSLCLVLVACSGPEKTWYELERAGAVIGYLEIWTEPHDSASTDPVITRGRLVQRVTLLGRSMDLSVVAEERADPRTGKTNYIDMRIRNGATVTGSTCRIDQDTLRYTMQPAGETRSLHIGPDVIVGRGVDFPFLVGVEPGDSAVARRFLDNLRCRYYERSFAPLDAETLYVGDGAYACVVFDTYNPGSGAASRLWVDRSTGALVRETSADGASMTLSDESVRGRVQRANVDDLLFVSVNVEIDDVRAISAMKVRAKVRTTGQRVTRESLNVPGQSFVGTVERNLIDGVFEIRHARYDASDPPPFPPVVPEAMQRYLEPELAIECNHPAIVKKARELTAGATDSWDASRRIARFVGDEIAGDIPGGGSALGTLREGKAECGGHSRLYAALCRAAGIPARCVMGCMYTEIKGGTFGQHMWNEVYMGEQAGWVPIDATAREFDYVDSGHIRLGGLTSFNPVEMEVLEYETGERVPVPPEYAE